MSVTLEQVAQWHDEQGHNGLWYVMQVVSQLLDPRTSEFTAAFVGRLVSTLISKAGRELGENLDQILRAILSKMQQAETLSVMQVGRGGSGRTALSPGPSSPGPSSPRPLEPRPLADSPCRTVGCSRRVRPEPHVSAPRGQPPPWRLRPEFVSFGPQSLIMVFAHLVHTQLEPLLEFLCSLPGPTGKPALEFVMAEWTGRQHLFYGQYEGKVRWASPPPPRVRSFVGHFQLLVPLLLTCV